MDRSRRFYHDVLGLAIYREFGLPDDPGVVLFLGPGLLEVSGHTDDEHYAATRRLTTPTAEARAVHDPVRRRVVPCLACE